MLDQILEGISMALTWQGLAMVAIGVFAGIAVGAIPGLSGVVAISILLPFAFFLPPVLGIPFLLGIHKGSRFGGAITAVLVNIPGEASSAATCLDGHPLAQKGEARSAIQMALYASALGDTFSDIALVLAAIPLATVALAFGPAEFFGLVVMGLSIIASVTGRSVVKGLLVALIGVFFGLVGLEDISGARRFTLGLANLEEGVGLVPLVIGLFGVSEVFLQSEKKLAELARPPSSARLRGGRPLPLIEVRRCARTILRSSIIGTIIGAIPGTGATTAAFVGYAAAKRASRHPEQFGKGSYEGVAACETADSAVAGADLIPTLTLGIPGSGTAAVLMGAFMAQGLRPGPFLFQEHGPTMYAIFTLLLLAIPIMLLQGLLLSGLFARMINIRQSLLLPSILLFCAVGSYLYQNSLGDVALALVAGVLAYGLRKMDYPMAPLIIAFILTPMAERALKQALILSDGDFSVFITQPIPAVLLGVGALVVLSALWRRRRAPAGAV